MTLCCHPASLGLLAEAGTLLAGDTMLSLRISGPLATVPVSINGHGPFQFALDTSSQNSMIDQKLAAGLALRPTHRVEIVTMTGVPAMPVSPAEIRMGPTVLHLGDLANVDRLPALRKAGQTGRHSGAGCPLQLQLPAGL